MGSTRLPGKSLAPIAGSSMLARVVTRAQEAKRLDAVVVATTVAPGDEAIVGECRRTGVDCFRGSEADVLDRYHTVVDQLECDVVVRLTADCPLLDPAVIDEVVEQLVSGTSDYASNTLRRTFPRGLDCEALWREALDRAWREAREPYQRTHVTPYIYENTGVFKLVQVVADADYSHHRWTVDTNEDLDVVRAIYARMSTSSFTWRDVLALVEEEPALEAGNRHQAQKPLHQG